MMETGLKEECMVLESTFTKMEDRTLESGVMER